MKYAHVVVICLNCYLGPTLTKRIVGAHGPDGRPRRDFLARRVPLMCRFTLPSLLEQTSENFTVFLLFDRRLSVHDFLNVAEVREFGDRFRAVGVEPIDFRRDVKNSFWRPRAAEDAALRQVAGGAERLLITYVDSDDSIREDAVELIQNLRIADKTQCIMPQHGYIHDSIGRRLRHFDVPSPPFYTLVYAADRYFQGHRYHGGAGHHYHVFDRLRCEVLAERIFMVNIHSDNDASTYRVGRLSPDLTATEYARILARFGLVDGVEPR